MLSPQVIEVLLTAVILTLVMIAAGLVAEWRDRRHIPAHRFSNTNTNK